MRHSEEGGEVMRGGAAPALGLGVEGTSRCVWPCIGWGSRPVFTCLPFRYALDFKAPPTGTVLSTLLLNWTVFNKKIGNFSGEPLEGSRRSVLQVRDRVTHHNLF